MRIQKIILNNFGSYEGSCSFDIRADNSEKRIIVIGGKNGAGKTTMFTALQVCLYGYNAFGYKSAGRQYYQTIRDLLNTNSKLTNVSSSYVCVYFNHVDEQGYNEYKVLRFWELKAGEIVEKVGVWKNQKLLSDEEIGLFQNYLIHLIPPDMLKLYFFDGEKIADYFLSDQKLNIRQALMVLSGNDTFDILHDNLKRILNKDTSTDSQVESNYLDKKDEVEDLLRGKVLKEEALGVTKSNLEITASNLQKVRDDYSKKGGITQDEWKNIQYAIKDEETKREKLNYERKQAATDVLPFIIMKDIVKKVSPQLDAEHELQMYEYFSQKVDSEIFRKRMMAILKSLNSSDIMQKELIIDEIKSYLLEGKDNDTKPLLSLSEDERGSVANVLNRVNKFPSDGFKNLKQELDASLNKTKELREKLQGSSIENYGEYLKETSLLEREIDSFKKQELDTENELTKIQEDIVIKQQELKIARKEFEQQLKKESVSALAGRTFLMVEDLQNLLYTKLIKNVEEKLNFKLRQLIRKQNFFDNVIIDENFNVHILRKQTIRVSDIRKMKNQGGMVNVRNTIGKIAYKSLFGTIDEITVADFNNALDKVASDSIELQIEVDKNRMSSGEQQIFVMALYWAIMQQSRSDIPFVIDTPFARTDTEHRANITEYFFKELKGQLFILSTNEEIGEGHIQSMKEQISNTFMLEYGSDKRTRIQEGKYFEV